MTVRVHAASRAEPTLASKWALVTASPPANVPSDAESSLALSAVQAAAALQRLLPGDAGADAPSRDDLRTELVAFHRSDFSVFDAQLIAWGHGTYPVGALFNHSCAPNCIAMFEGREQVVRAAAGPAGRRASARAQTSDLPSTPRAVAVAVNRVPLARSCGASPP